MEGKTRYTKWLAYEAQLTQKHEEILAKREMLLAASESLVNTQQKKLKTITRDFHRAKARNNQLVKELEEFHNGLQRKVSSCSNDDVHFISQQESYWKMVEEELPRWIARNSPSREINVNSAELMMCESQEHFKDEANPTRPHAAAFGHYSKNH